MNCSDLSACFSCDGSSCLHGPLKCRPQINPQHPQAIAVVPCDFAVGPQYKLTIFPKFPLPEEKTTLLLQERSSKPEIIPVETKISLVEVYFINTRNLTCPLHWNKQT